MSQCQLWLQAGYTGGSGSNFGPESPSSGKIWTSPVLILDPAKSHIPAPSPCTMPKPQAAQVSAQACEMLRLRQIWLRLRNKYPELDGWSWEYVGRLQFRFRLRRRITGSSNLQVSCGFRYLTGTSKGVIIFSLHQQNTCIIPVVDFQVVIDTFKCVNWVS